MSNQVRRIAVWGTGTPLSAVRVVACSLVCLVCSTVVATPSLAQTNRTLTALSSYAQPPFSYGNSPGRRGLSELLIQLVQSRIGEGPNIQLQTVPRRRMEVMLGEPGFNGVALFLAPEFLTAAASSGARWSAPVMVDENVVVSTVPRTFASPSDFAGLRLGGISGHIYPVFGPHVEAGRIHREDAPDHISNLKKLCLGRVDFLVMSRSEFSASAMLATCGRPYLSQAFPDPQVIIRRVLVRSPDDAQATRLLDAIEQVACSEAWTSAIATYGLGTVGCSRKKPPRAASP